MPKATTKSSLMAAALLVAACAAPGAEEGTAPLAEDTDLTVQTVASATCSRGSGTVALRVSEDGSATGNVIGRPVPFAATLVPAGPSTVVLTITEGTRDNQEAGEAMSPARRAGEVILRGTTFECWNVRVRAPA